jgi:hypothetical protein
MSILAAVVTGRLRGFSVSARFGRKDGCEVARWNRVAFLFPGVGTSPSGSEGPILDGARRTFARHG